MKRDVVSVIKFLIKITMNNHQDEYFMTLALKEARKAYIKKEVPVGCVIVLNGEVIARAHNQRHKNKSVFDHAEIIAIKKANKKLNSWMLDEAIMYVTLEPCLMCAGAIIQSRIKRIVYAATEPKFGVFGSVLNLKDHMHKFNHQLEVTPLIMKEESSTLLKTFFKEIRNTKS